jgi:hypothetical protein
MKMFAFQNKVATNEGGAGRPFGSFLLRQLTVKDG